MRQWRKAVPYLAAKPGKAARFTFSDLVSLAVTSELTGNLGARISEVGRGVDGLFRAFAEARPAHLQGLVAVVERETARLMATSEFNARQLTRPAFVVPCDPVIAEISARMLPVTPGPSQTALPFPPQAVRAGG